MRNAKDGIMLTLFACMGFGKTHYTTARIDTLRRLMKDRHKKDIKRRWTFRCLEDLIAEKLITRKQRFRNDENGEVQQISSMISFSLRGGYQLWAMGVTGAAKLIKQIKAWMKGVDQRWPKRENMEEKFTPLEIAENERRLKELVFSL